MWRLFPFHEERFQSAANPDKARITANNTMTRFRTAESRSTVNFVERRK
jgi:hypothetical protein